MTWLNPSKYEQIRIESATGPGTYVPSNWKFVCHSTEGPAGSIAGTIALFQSKPSYCPHLTIDPMGTGRRVQHIRLDYSACALKGGRYGWQTNRAHAIQMEICGYASQSQGWPDEALWQIADVIADVIAAGYPININNVPDSSTLTGTLATETAPQRFSGAAWHDFDGIASHVYVPFNDHWDAGRLPARTIAAHVKEILNGRHVPLPVAHAGGAATPAAQGLIVEGMVGGQVTLIQQLINGLGYRLDSDGVFGPNTLSAVQAFQHDHGLVADGIVGPATQAALSAAYAPFHPGVPPIPPPDPNAPAWPGRYIVLTHPYTAGADVHQWQVQMAKRGWRIGIDGIYGEASYGICKTFQHDKGLTRDGIIGPQTWGAAWSAPVT